MTKLKERPNFTRFNRNASIEEARDGYGRVICEHCQHEITDQQQITINHKWQWQAFRDHWLQDERFQSLDFLTQKKFLKKIFNDVGNLQPLHVACHREVDFNTRCTPEEAAKFNAKTFNKKDRLYTREEAYQRITQGHHVPSKHILAFAPAPSDVVVEEPSIAQLNSTEPIPVPPPVSETEISQVSSRANKYLKPYGWLLATIAVKTDELPALADIPQNVRAFYREITAQRLLQTINKQEVVRSKPDVYAHDLPASVIGNPIWDINARLARRESALREQLTFLDRLAAEAKSSLSR